MVSKQVKRINAILGDNKLLTEMFARNPFAQAQAAMGDTFMYGEQCADTDGMAAHEVPTREYIHKGRIAELEAERVGMLSQLNQQAAEIAERGVRIANHDRTIATLMTQLIGKDATIAGLRTEAQRLSELAQDLQAQLNARHGAAGEPQTGVSIPCETPRVNPFVHGWATNWKMR